MSPIAAIARRCLRLIPDEAVLPILSGPLRGYRWIVGSGRKAYWFGIYERHFQRLLWSELSSQSVFYDIGANAGFYSLLAARKGASVIAIEPSPTNAVFVRRHIELNRCHRICLHEVAISDRDGTANFVGDGASGHLGSAGFPIRTVMLDSLVSSGLPAPTHIKMDIEGEEFKALRGAQQSLLTYRPVIFLAVHGHGIHKQCESLLSRWGFSIQVLATLDDGRADLLVR